jgi:hypothetical protein
VKPETMRSTRRRLAILAGICMVVGLPFVLTSHRGSTVFEIGATLIGIGGGLLTLVLIFAPLSRLTR